MKATAASIPRFEEWHTGRAQVGAAHDVGIAYRWWGSGPPLVLLHGWPQHSLMWHRIGPLLADRFTVVALDQRGVGMSTIHPGPYDKRTLADDLTGVLDSLEIDETYLASYDLGTGTAAAFAHRHPDRVAKIAFMEFLLPGFGYEDALVPQPTWSLYANWHLALFTVPEAAEFLIRGREREMLAWYFHHIGYSGNASISNEHFDAYVREMSKPGALRSGIEYYSSVFQDMIDNEVFASSPLTMPALALGGEASLGPVIDTYWREVCTDLRSEVVPRAGHWLSDENPEYTAQLLADFFRAGDQPLPPFQLVVPPLYG